MKPSWVDSDVLPMSFAQPSIISGGMSLPSRPGIVQRAQLSTPFFSICSSHEAARAPTETSPETMPPSTASERTRSGWRAASRNAIGAGHLRRADMESLEVERVGKRNEIRR